MFSLNGTKAGAPDMTTHSVTLDGFTSFSSFGTTYFWNNESEYFEFFDPGSTPNLVFDIELDGNWTQAGLGISDGSADISDSGAVAGSFRELDAIFLNQGDHVIDLSGTDVASIFGFDPANYDITLGQYISNLDLATTQSQLVATQSIFCAQVGSAKAEQTSSPTGQAGSITWR